MLRMERRSKFRAISVSQVRLADIEVSAVVKLGEMGCWFELNGNRVWEFWLKSMWFNLSMSEIMVWALWFLKGECHD